MGTKGRFDIIGRLIVRQSYRKGCRYTGRQQILRIVNVMGDGNVCPPATSDRIGFIRIRIVGQ